MFLANTPYSLIALLLHPGVEMGTSEFNAGGVFRWTGVPSWGDRNIPFRFMLQKIQPDKALGSTANLPCLPSVEEVLKIHTLSEFNF